MKIARVQTTDRLINQLQQNICSAVEPMLSDLTGTFVFNVTGCTATIGGVANWSQSTLNGLVVIQFPSVTGTSNATTCTITGLPTQLFPAFSQTPFIRIQNNGADALGLAVIDTDGSLVLYKDASGNAFTASGSKGLLSSVVTYILGT